MKQGGSDKATKNIKGRKCDRKSTYKQALGERESRADTSTATLLSSCTEGSIDANVHTNTHSELVVEY